MGFFDDEGFDNMVREMFNGRTSKRATNNISKAEKNQVITNKNVFFVYDFSGFEEINVEIRDEEVINDYNEKVHTGEKVLIVSGEKKILVNQVIEEQIKIKGFKWTFKNGILEVTFKR